MNIAKDISILSILSQWHSNKEMFIATEAVYKINNELGTKFKNKTIQKGLGFKNY